MKEGTIVEWAVADGARVERDQVVFVLSTDKLDTDVTAEVSGTLHHRAGMRETHPVGTVVAVILANGEVLPGGLENGSPARVVSSPYARRLARELDIELADVRGSGPGGRVVAADVTRERTPSERRGPLLRHQSPVRWRSSSASTSPRWSARVLRAASRSPT